METTKSINEIKNMIAKLRQAGDTSVDFEYIESVYELLPPETQTALYQDLHKELQELTVGDGPQTP